MHTRRSFGLTCDHLIRIKMVDGTGRSAIQRRNRLCSGVRAAVAMAIRDSRRTDIQHARRPAQFSSWKFRAYKLDPKRTTALLETWFEATSDLPNDVFQAWIMNGSEVTVVSSLLVRASKNGW